MMRIAIVVLGLLLTTCNGERPPAVVAPSTSYSVNSLDDGDVEFDRYSLSKYASHQAIQTPQAMESIRLSSGMCPT
jgi:hypothetical protein